MLGSEKSRGQIRTRSEGHVYDFKTVYARMTFSRDAYFFMCLFTVDRRYYKDPQLVNMHRINDCVFLAPLGTLQRSPYT